jgi:PLP dependent protein
MVDVAARVAANVAAVRDRIATAARHSGRSPDSVALVAVTKSMSAEVVACLLPAGCTRFGESRPQELWDKAISLEAPAKALGVTIDWHLIGHLQRNKIRRTLPLVRMIQSVDSQRLLLALDAEAALRQLPVDLLLEVNVSLDTTKTGLPPDQMPHILRTAATLRHVAVRGLMGMASLTGGQSAAARDFARLRELRDTLNRDAPSEISLAELSMGMSDDFEVAIREGATIVRVGSALFEGLEP